MENTKQSYLSLEQAKTKLEHFCAYQERCHSEVTTKMYNLKIAIKFHDEIIVYLIEHNFLNEERFARSFARGKHRISYWGKNRIISELKLRQISSILIKKALEEIDDSEYYNNFNKLSHIKWNTIKETNIEKKKQKFQATLFRKGYNMDMIIDKTNELIQEESF